MCTADCGKAYANSLSTTCNDDFGAETLKGYCTPTNGEATIGSHCRFALAGDMLNFSDHLGCCYQSLYNNTDYLQGFLDNGFIISPAEFAASQSLNDPLFSTWTLCSVPICRGEPFPTETTPLPSCTLEEQIAMLQCVVQT